MLPLYKVAGCVVFYNPDSDVLLNITTYYDHIELLIVIDNSDVLNTTLCQDLNKVFPKLIYVYLNKNAGIAAALNIACNMALERSFDWIVTMDQDSSFMKGHLVEMILDIPTVISKFDRVAIITPLHVLHEKAPITKKEKYSQRSIAMTSGNLLNLKAYKEVGSFDENLFMDFVDYEYCLRARKNNYKIVQNNFVHLKHSLGKYSLRRFLGRQIGVSNHSDLRRYYMTRNSLHVGVKYIRYDIRFFFHVLWNVFIWDLFIIITYETNKAAKVKSVCKGITHFLSNKLGKA